MPDYYPNIHHRKSIRLKGYDYSKAGWYFITICVQTAMLFGETGAATVRAQDVHVGRRYVGVLLIRAPLTFPNTVPIKKFGVPMGEMVDWFKTMTTNEYIRGLKAKGGNGSTANCNVIVGTYYQDDGSYSRIAAYILQNPSKWEGDQLNPGN